MPQSCHLSTGGQWQHLCYWAAVKQSWYIVSTQQTLTWVGSIIRGAQAPVTATVFPFARLLLLLNTEHVAARAGRGSGTLP